MYSKITTFPAFDALFAAKWMRVMQSMYQNYNWRVICHLYVTNLNARFADKMKACDAVYVAKLQHFRCVTVTRFLKQKFRRVIRSMNKITTLRAICNNNYL